MPERIVIDRRFRGPPASANGGYGCGLLGVRLDGLAEVTLRAPPPLDRPLVVSREDGAARLLDGEAVVAEAKPGAITVAAPDAPTLGEAIAASERYPWRETHPLPGCFVCGSARAPGDGLAVFPGPVAGRELAAAPFLGDPSLAGDDGLLRPEIVWSLLDCPSWFGHMCSHGYDGLALLGRLTARIDRRPRATDRTVVAGWPLGREGRKIFCASALYSEQGELLAIGQATWVVLKAPER